MITTTKSIDQNAQAEEMVLKYKVVVLIALAMCIALGSIPAPSTQALTVNTATPLPTTASGFTQWFAGKHDMTWSGGDQMTSLKLPNGLVYWLSGDTMISNGIDADGSYPDGAAMISNRILVQSGGTLTNAMTNNGMAIPNPSTATPANQERYWPQAEFYANSRLYVLCQHVIKNPDPNSLGFKPVGTDMAKFSVNSAGKLTLMSILPTPATGVTSGVGPALTQWAGDAIVTGGYVYVYGYTMAPHTEPQYVVHYSYVARVPSAQVETPAAWQYYKKSTDSWVSNVNMLSNDVSNPDALVASQIASVRVIGGKVVILHKPWNGYGSPVYAEVGTRPQGPFVTTKLFDSPAGTWQGRSYITYAPMLHPEQVLGKADAGKTLVSIDRNGVDFWADTLANANLYKPQFYTVKLP